jgi:hypothetical protein
MTLGREDVSVTRTDGGADVFRLARLLGDDDLISHGSLRRIDSTAAESERIGNEITSQGVPGSTGLRILIRVPT